MISIIKDKRGMSHLEVIISFVIFLGFVIFLLTFLNPFKSSPPTSLLKSLEIDVSEKLETDLYSISVSLDSEPSSACFTINMISDFSGCNVIAKDISGDLISAEKRGDSIAIQEYGGEEDQFYTLYCSEDLESSENDPGDNCEDYTGNYELGMLKKDKIFANDKILDLVRNYDENYETTKNEFKVPRSLDYGFVIRDGYREMIPEFSRMKEAASPTERIASTIDVRILNEEEATSETAFLSIIIW